MLGKVPIAANRAGFDFAGKRLLTWILVSRLKVKYKVTAAVDRTLAKLYLNNFRYRVKAK